MLRNRSWLLKLGRRFCEQERFLKTLKSSQAKKHLRSQLPEDNKQDLMNFSFSQKKEMMDKYLNLISEETEEFKRQMQMKNPKEKQNLDQHAVKTDNVESEFQNLEDNNIHDFDIENQSGSFKAPSETGFDDDMSSQTAEIGENMLGEDTGSGDQSKTRQEMRNRLKEQGPVDAEFENQENADDVQDDAGKGPGNDFKKKFKEVKMVKKDYYYSPEAIGDKIQKITNINTLLDNYMYPHFFQNQ